MINDVTHSAGFILSLVTSQQHLMHSAAVSTLSIPCMTEIFAMSGIIHQATDVSDTHLLAAI